MKIRSTYKMVSLSLIASAFLAGCGSSGSSTVGGDMTTSAPLNGSIIKGPIDGAIITLKDANGKTIGTANTSKGAFSFKQVTLKSDYYILESRKGRYTDEATQHMVSMSGKQGLKTLLSKEEAEAFMKSGKALAMTPETTIFADLVKTFIAKGQTLSAAMNKAERLITATLITGTTPLSSVEKDTFMREGDLSLATPKMPNEAFARNRAAAMSYMVRDFGLQPLDVFTMIDKITEDLKDGAWDGTDLNGDGMMDNVNASFGLARTKIFLETSTKLRKGTLGKSKREALRLMGFDVDKFMNGIARSQAALDAEVKKYLASNTLPSLNILPTLTDEDGNPSDAKATYTLTANTSVNVTVTTPEGSWVTPMWRYNNNPLPMVIRTKRGYDMTLHFDNKLASDSTIHWHGFKIPADMDGGPDIPVAKNASKTYTFTMDQPAAPLWFHPHPDMQTGKQVYMGLAGVYLLEDDITETLESTHQIPSGLKDTVLLVQDRRFDGKPGDAVRNLQYVGEGMEMAMDLDGILGDTVLVNGSVMPKQEVSNTLHRFRLYNVSNARTYKFALSDGKTFKVIGTDGGLLDKPVELDSITLGAAERAEIVIDFSQYSVGDKVMLVSQPFNGDMMGMMNNGSGMGGDEDMGSGMNSNSDMDNGSSMDADKGMGDGMGDGMGSMDGMLANGVGLSIMRFDISSDETETVTLYDKLPNGADIQTRYTAADTTNAASERTFMMTMGKMDSMGGEMNSNDGMSDSEGMQAMTFVINGKTFDPNRVDEFIQAGATEIWKISNMSPMAHPFHAHAIQYQILSRNGIPASGVDLGWKDTFLLEPGDMVRVIGKFEAINTGDYMYHCHILEHEDAGMMGYFRVGDTGQLGAQ